MLERVATTCYRRRRLVVPAWLALLVGLGGLGSVAAGTTDDAFTLPGSPSQRAADVLADAGLGLRKGTEGRLVVHDPAGVTRGPARTAIERLVAELRGSLPAAEVSDPFAGPGGGQVSADGTTAIVGTTVPGDAAEATDTAKAPVERARQAVTDRTPGLRVELGGDLFTADSAQGGFSREAFGLLTAVVVLLVAFGSVFATGLPIVVAVGGAGCGIALTALVSNVIGMPSFTSAAAAMVAVGVGVDYALLVVTRYREGLRQGLPPDRAVVGAQRSAGRSVLFAGATVVVAVLGLLVMGLDLVNGVAVGIAAAVLMTMLAALTLLPALLGFAGTRVDRFGLPHRHRHGTDGGVARRWSRTVQRRPWPAALASLGVLVVLALPATRTRLGFGDAGLRDTTDTTRRAYDLVARGFGAGANGPLIIAVRWPAGRGDARAVDNLARQVAATSGVADVSPPIAGRSGTASLVRVVPETGPQDAATSDLVHRLRDDVLPAAVTGTDLTAYVGGVTATAIDYADTISARLPLFVGVVLALSLLVLMVVFRSLVVLVKAAVVNLLSLGATLGVTVAVFQWGWGVGLLGLGGAAPIEAWVPMMLFAVAFGLSMDYEVFLLTRMKEEYDRGLDNSTAVAAGLAATARVVTAAAAVMLCVFGSFVLGSDRPLQLFGFGLAAAVAIDATLVRLVLVPAAMELLGDRNWWLPRRLARVLPHLTVEPAAAGSVRPRRPPEPARPRR